MSFGRSPAFSLSTFVLADANPQIQSFIAASVPEPETYAMMLAGFGLIGFIVRRRKDQDPNMTFA